MANAQQYTSAANTSAVEQFDAIVIGAGVAGLYQLYRLRQLGLAVRCYEDGSDVGGTWHWNRYPGCRFDSESETYGYSFSKELLEEWTWTERFAERGETERYLKRVVDKYGLHKYIQLGCAVTSAHWSEHTRSWTV